VFILNQDVSIDLAGKNDCFGIMSRVTKDVKSATTSRAGGMSRSPGKGWDDALLVVADFFKEF
jgi:hypothetical protein